MNRLFLLMLLMLSASCSHQTKPVTLTMTKVKVVTVPESMLPTACPAIPSDLMVPPAPLVRIESPEQAPEAIKHNARELLGDRDRLIRFQDKFKPL